MQARDDPSLLVPAAAVWRGAASDVRRLVNPREKLLTGLGYAARFFEPLERAPRRAAPERLRLDTEEAFDFLRGARPCWRRAASVSWCPLVAPPRSPPETAPSPSAASDTTGRGEMSLENLVNYRWDIVLGERRLSKEEFEALVALKSPLVRLRGEWVRLDPEQVDAALEFFAARDLEGEVGLPEALRLGLGGIEELEGLEVEEADFEGWLGEWLGRLSGDRKLETLPVPADLEAELRPYQRTGYSWLGFLREAGLGACLADDMGFGKTIQTLSLLIHDQEQGRLDVPALVVCPTSVVSNWQREAERFAPRLRCLAHQGPNRLRGEEFVREAERTGLVVTSYALLRRDAQLLGSVRWHAVVLDEAQNIKNPGAKQSRLAYELPAGFRVALTGTPVENRLGSCGPSCGSSTRVTWAPEGTSGDVSLCPSSARATRRRQEGCVG